ncbi:MAG: nuclear transport factor 2 family protein [Actinobacteria bacterium]|nr:nuclear transport factor 2 family protein [Actinomycetota bacterium]
MSAAEIAERFIAAFSAADFEAMRELSAPDLVAWVTGPDGEMARVEGRDSYLGRVEAMDLPSARFAVELTQAPVEVGPDRVLMMVEVHAERGGRTLHNFAGHLLRIDGDRIAEWWMVDARPAESDTFWAS